VQRLIAPRGNPPFNGPKELATFRRFRFRQASSKIQRVATVSSSHSWQLNFPSALIIWIAIVTTAAIAGSRLGFGGRHFFLSLGIAAALFAFEFFLAAPAILARVRRSTGEAGVLFAPLVPLFAILIYALLVSGNATTMLIGAAYAVLPALLLSSCAGKPPGAWQDYSALLLIWLPVQFRWMYRLFPYPPPLTHALTILMALATAVAAFILLRRMDGVGYAIEWRPGFGWTFALHFTVLAAIEIPLGMRIGFLTYAPSVARLKWSLLEGLGILFFTAWPEEFLFRGVLQNLLTRSLKNQWGALILASIVFGFAHILHNPFPNWKYVLLATIAGLFYGRAYIKSGSLVPGALIHGLVDICWHILFR
jgi:uncharacterized protein